MLNRSLLRIRALKFAPQRSLTYIHHAFPIESAMNRFQEADAKRLMAPFVFESKAVASFTESPLKKVLIPVYGINTKISSTTYEGEYGIEHESTSTDSEGKTTTTRWTTWHDIKGKLEPITYTQEQNGTTIYAGFTWHADTIESALEGYSITEFLKPFDIKLIDDTTILDPFLKRSAIAQDEANQRINSFEQRRIHNVISRESGYSQTRINRFSINYSDFFLSDYLLPAYVLQYPEFPARVLPALSDSAKIIYGPSRFSIAKCLAAAAIPTAAAAFFFPQFTIPARIAAVALTSGISGLWAKYYGNHAQYNFQQRELGLGIKNNETVQETIADKNRFEATARNFPQTQAPLQFNAEFYRTLGLDPTQDVTKESVDEAFNKAIKAAHPDMKGGSTDKTRKIIAARYQFKNANNGRRNFSTYELTPKRQLKAPPRSVFDPNAHKLIELVIDKQDYNNALILVNSGRVHADGHDKGENTLITEIAKRGSVKDFNFAIDKLKCSIDTSCDCPVHNTGLHYGAMRGSEEMVNAFILKKARINLINSYGETATDIAVKNGNENLKLKLIAAGGIQHSTVEGADGAYVKLRGKVFGYSADHRTILENIDKPNTIYLGSNPTSNKITKK